jgi:hypothetical protein
MGSGRADPADIFRRFNIEHAKTIVVFCGENHIFRAGSLDHQHPFIGIEISRIEVMK